jgi:hypothetical protein
MNIFSKFKEMFLRPFRTSLPRFPEAILTSFLLGILMVINNELDVFNEILNDVTRSLILVLPFLISLVLLIEKFPQLSNKRWYIFSGTMLLGVAFFTFLRLETSEAVEFNRFSNLFYAGYLLPMFLPELMNRPNVETGIILRFTKFFTAFLYALVLYIGIFIVLISANVLFELSLNLIIYANLLIIIVTFVFTPTFLGSYPQANYQLSIKKDYHIVWQRIFILVIAPVISIFTGLVIIYLITGFFSVNTYEAEVYTFSTLVIAFAGISTQVALKPFTKKNKFVEFFVNYFHYGLLIVVIGYYFEQIKTIAFYGISLSVVIQLMLGIWPLTYILFKVLKHKIATQKGLLMLVGVFTWIAALPGLNAVSVTTMLLNLQMRNLLVQNEMLSNEGTIIPQNPLPAELFESLNRTVDEMNRLGVHRFSILPDGYTHPQDFEVTFGVPEYDPTKPREEVLEFTLKLPVIDLTGLHYDKLIYVSSIHTLKNGESFMSHPLTLNLNVNATTHAYNLTIDMDAHIETIDLYEDVAQALKTRFNANTYESLIPTDFLLSFTFDNFDVDIWVINCLSFKYETYADFNIGFYLGVTLNHA